MKPAPELLFSCNLVINRLRKDRDKAILERWAQGRGHSQIWVLLYLAVVVAVAAADGIFWELEPPLSTYDHWAFVILLGGPALSYAIYLARTLRQTDLKVTRKAQRFVRRAIRTDTPIKGDWYAVLFADRLDFRYCLWSASQWQGGGSFFRFNYIAASVAWTLMVVAFLAFPAIGGSILFDVAIFWYFGCASFLCIRKDRVMNRMRKRLQASHCMHCNAPLATSATSEPGDQPHDEASFSTANMKNWTTCSSCGCVNPIHPNRFARKRMSDSFGAVAGLQPGVS